VLNKKQQNVIFSNGELELGHPTLPKSIPYKTGLSNVIKENSNFYVINVTALKPTTLKTFEEAKGQLLADYQIVLESEWINDLRAKFKVVINQDVLAKVNAIISN
jgi:peptidyl-prolyl cis-trans isomerase SurA